MLCSTVVSSTRHNVIIFSNDLSFDFFVIVRRSVYILFTNASKFFVPFGSRGPVARPLERMWVASPNLLPLSELGTGKVVPKMEFQSCTGTQLCPTRGKKAGKGFR